MKKNYLLIIFFFISGCLGYMNNTPPVEDFQLEKYLGKWYEIARLDNSFEKGFEQVSAEYSLRADGGVKVLNKGYNPEKKIWKEAIGKAFFVEEKEKGYLKVSFFGPFYGSYVVFEIDEGYNYAFVTSSKKSYLWFLSRTPKVDDEMIEHFKLRAESFGFNLDKLVIVNQDRNDKR